MWLSVVCTFVDNDTRHYRDQNHGCATNWATSQSGRFALVIEYVSSIHPWANSRCWISQSECALCSSYVINRYWQCLCKPKKKMQSGKRPRYEFSVRSRKIWLRETKVKYSLFSFLHLLSPFDSYLYMPLDWNIIVI